MGRPRSDIQDRILAAARARFLAEGVEAASLRNIAKDADTSIGMVYYYYSTKDDLFLAIVEECYQKFLTDLEEVLRTRHGYQERMGGFYARLGAMSDAEMEIAHLVVRESLTSNDRRDRLRTRFLRGHLPLLFGAILEGFEAGELDRSISPIVAMACSLAIGSVTAMTNKFACFRPDSVTNDATVPSFVRDAFFQLATQLPSGDALAEQLSQIAVRALGKR